MSTEQQTQIKKPVIPQIVNPLDVYNDAANQELVQRVKQKGFYVVGAVESFQNDKKETVEYAFIQILVKARDESKAMQIKKIKVREEQRGLLEFLAAHTFKFISLDLDVVTRGNDTNFYLSAEQSALKLTQ